MIRNCRHNGASPRSGFVAVKRTALSVQEATAQDGVGGRRVLLCLSVSNSIRPERHATNSIHNTGHTQNNGAVLIVFTIKTAPLFCVCPVRATFPNKNTPEVHYKLYYIYLTFGPFPVSSSDNLPLNFAVSGCLFYRL
jgi:hypothetical protein